MRAVTINCEFSLPRLSSIKMISLALTMTMSGRAEVSRISAGIVDGDYHAVALNPGRSAYSLSPGWRYSLRPRSSRHCHVARYTLCERYRATI